MRPRGLLYYGREEALPEVVPLRAGPLRLEYCAGEIRNILLGTRPVVQRIYAAVRDRNWGTVANAISNERIHPAGDKFRLSFDSENRQGDIDFTWRGEITGDAQGNITYLFDGEVGKPFQTCRIGLCILHPLETCAGRGCSVEKQGGVRAEGVFPRAVVAGEVPPFIDMTGMTYEVTPSARVRLSFEGDLFELEDQRNWSDAPYKTFCTPSRLETPRQVTAGTRVRQSVRCSLVPSGATSAALGPAEHEAIVRVAVDRQIARRLPTIGLGVASHGGPLSPRAVDCLKALNLSHLRVDLTPGRPGWRPRLAQAAREAADLGIALEVAWHVLDAGAEVNDLVDALGHESVKLSRLLVFREDTFVTEAQDVVVARQGLARRFPALQIGGGSNADFSELNQHGAPFELLDLVCYSANPQVHGTGNHVLVENLEAQAYSVESARRLSQGLPVVVSPVTLKQRFNPAASGPPLASAEGELPPEVDARQLSLLGVGWTAGSLHALCVSGAASITYFETTGWRGVMETGAGSPMPERFRSVAGQLFPVYHVLADVGEFAGGVVVQTSSTRPPTAVGLAVAEGRRTRLVVANLTPKDQQIAIGGVEGSASVRMLDESNAEAAMTDPDWRRLRPTSVYTSDHGELKIGLLPFGVATIDWQ